MKPRAHIHGAIQLAERKMHDNIMSGQHIIDIIQRYTLGQASDI